MVHGTTGTTNYLELNHGGIGVVGLVQGLVQGFMVLLVVLSTWRGNHGGIEQLQLGESVQYRGLKTHLCASRGWIW